MSDELSKAQVDRLGDRLREARPTRDDLVLLDRFRRSYTNAYETVIATIRSELHLEPTGRPAKSTRSIVDKLGRESIRLSQMQDIAGCRFIVPDVSFQSEALRVLVGALNTTSVDDRRTRPSHGYRAVHVVASLQGKPVEIQIRTQLQHIWAELSEKYSDVVDPEIKYGGGPADVREILSQSSELVAILEQEEQGVGRISPDAIDVVRQNLRGLMQSQIDELRRRTGLRR